jgi:hypothetical protein
MFIDIILKKIKIMDVYLKDLRVKSLIFEEVVEVFIKSCDHVIFEFKKKW